ncbi:MAG: hypothetical protein FJW39_03490 [Acidobacteria bacterium]|nr:hypothetical protein [Acidobacteriota bacterium]
MILAASLVLMQLAQNPSPMTETTRAHPRLKQVEPAGRRIDMRVGRLFLPARFKPGGKKPLIVHFHGAPWIAELAGELQRTAVVTVQLGAGSSRYAAPFREDPELFRKLLAEAREMAKTQFDPVILSSWSAGYGAIREILRGTLPPVGIRILLIDSVHAGYSEAAQTDPSDMAEFLDFARLATQGKRRMAIVHSEIYPGTFASTTETADYLLAKLGIRRKAVLRWGPMGTQQLSDTRRGGLRVMGFAGNSAPDHIDHIHALPEFLKMMR